MQLIRLLVKNSALQVLTMAIELQLFDVIRFVRQGRWDITVSRLRLSIVVEKYKQSYKQRYINIYLFI